MGGNGPQSLVNLACLAIQRGDSDLVLLGGAEAWRTRMGARSAGGELEWTRQDDSVPEAPRSIPEVPMSSPGEQARALMMPVQVYPLFEQAHRVVLGRGLDEHLVAMSELWAGFSAGGRHQPARVDPGGLHRRGDPHAVARQPDDRLPVHEAAELQQRGRAGRGADPVLGGAGRGARRAARPLGVPAQRHRRARPLLRERARRPRPLAGHAHRRPRVPRAGRRRRRRPRPHRPLLLLPVGGGDLGLRARDRPRSAAHRHRRPVASPAVRGTTT